jgi:hypothetical protein
MCDYDKQYDAQALQGGWKHTRFIGAYTVPEAVSYNRYMRAGGFTDRILYLQNRGEDLWYEWNEAEDTFDPKGVE